MMTQHSIIKQLIDRLIKYPDVHYSTTHDSITVEPKDEKGFTVSLAVGPGELIVSADFWHEHFDENDKEEALNCFAFLLSDSCRLRIDYRGEKPTRWTIESFENADWVGDSTTGRINLNFWSPKRTQYFQNDLIKIREQRIAESKK